MRIAGHHWGDPLCFTCFYPYAPEVAALLRLDEAARQAADTLDSRNLLTVAVSYTELLYSLDAEHPREEVSRDPTPRDPAPRVSVPRGPTSREKPFR